MSVRALVKLILAVVCGGALLLAYWLFVPVMPPGEKFVEIPPRIPALRMAAELQAEGVIHNRLAFDVLHLVLRRKLKAGEYRFQESATVFQVYSRIAHGDVYARLLVIPEGFNMFDVAGAVQDAKLATRDEFLSAAQSDTQLIQDLDPQARNLEGYLFPDTYKFTRLDSVHTIAAAMVKRFRQESNQLGVRGDVHQVVTLASLVEKEVAVPDERPLVASVFQNRLAAHIPLMTDPTVIYAALLGGNYNGAIYRSDLASSSPYNTYKNEGLPPGPICNPGSASLLAALHPAQSDYLYFVSDSHGHSRFSKTLEEHNRNVIAYRRASASR